MGFGNYSVADEAMGKGLGGLYRNLSLRLPPVADVSRVLVRIARHLPPETKRLFEK